MDELTPVVVFEIFGIGITNTVVSTWLVMLVTLGLAYLLHKRQPIVLEMLVDFINDTVSDMMGRPALRQLSLIGTLFHLYRNRQFNCRFSLYLTPDQ
jgi:F0F1-type ATP synthase membrane subunit a